MTQFTRKRQTYRQHFRAHQIPRTINTTTKVDTTIIKASFILDIPFCLLSGFWIGRSRWKQEILQYNTNIKLIQLIPGYDSVISNSDTTKMLEFTFFHHFNTKSTTIRSTKWRFSKLHRLSNFLPSLSTRRKKKERDCHIYCYERRVITNSMRVRSIGKSGFRS